MNDTIQAVWAAAPRHEPFGSRSGGHVRGTVSAPEPWLAGQQPSEITLAYAGLIAIRFGRTVSDF